MLLAWFYLCLGLSFAYKLKCPDESQWAIRARVLCGDLTNYFCLWDGNALEYIEGCKKADFTRSGERYEWFANFDSKFCPKGFYQPYLHWSNESSGCIYKKSLCNEEGQVVYDDTDTKQDTKCTCDYTRGYDFITKPNNPCYCIPAEEDCSCFLNPCVRTGFENESGCKNNTLSSYIDKCGPLKNITEEHTTRTITIQIIEIIGTESSNEDVSQGQEAGYMVLVCILVLLVICGLLYPLRHSVDNMINEKIRKVYVKHGLTDKTYNEGEECKLQCKLSKLNAHVVWTKDGVILYDTDRIRITVDGRLHTLTVHPVLIEDVGKYELQLRTNGRTDCEVRVKPVYAVRPLVDITCYELDECTLECEMSSSEVPVNWYKNGKFLVELNNMEKTTINCYQSLTIKCMSQYDGGDYELRHLERTITKCELKFKPVYAVRPLVDVTCYELDECTLECEISSSEVPVSWYKYEDLIVETNNIQKSRDNCCYRLTIKCMAQDDGGAYELRHLERTITKCELKFKPVFLCELDRCICVEGDNVVLSCKASEEDMSAIWYKEEKKLTETERVKTEVDGRTHILKIKKAYPKDSGHYTIQIKNVKQNANLTVKAFIKTHIYNTVIMEGLDIVLKCETEKSGLRAQWYKDGKEITKESNNINIEETDGVYKLSISSVHLSHKGQYKVLIRGHYSQAFVDVKEIPQILKKMSKNDRDKFMEAAKAGTAPRYYIRIMIVGESGVGKTCLLRRLLDEGIDDVISTDGINIEVRKCRIDLKTGEWIVVKDQGKILTKWTKEDERYADCVFWDFAGQKEYYATHQTFLSSNAIYLLATDISKDLTKAFEKKIEEREFISVGEFIEFWLNNIHCYVSDIESVAEGDLQPLNPPVMLVGTGTDKIEKSLNEQIKDFEDHLDDLLGNEIKRRHLQNRVYVSNILPNTSEFAIIRDRIFALAKKMPKWGDHLPIRWILLEKQMFDLNENIVSFKKVRSYAVECALSVEGSSSEFDAFLRYEHEIGNIIFFDDIKEYIILDPGWLVDAFRCLVAHEQFQSTLINFTELKRSGKISNEIIELLFQKVPELNFIEHKPFLLKIMEIFDILVKSPFEVNNSGIYYMPCMMNATSFENVCRKLKVTENQCHMTSWLCVDFTFLPPGFFNHVLVTYIKKYPLVMECENKPALYRGIGIFNLMEDGCRKIALCVSSNTIAMQIWEWDGSSGQYYGDLREELLKNIAGIEQRYRIHIEYTINLKCSNGHFYQLNGKQNPTQILGSQQFYCDEHHETHESKSVYLPWYSETKKDKDEERRKDIKDTEFGRCIKCNTGPSVHWCYECDAALCWKCQIDHFKSTKHHVQYVKDKYTLDYTFNVNVNEIFDIKKVSDGLMCVADYNGGQLVTVDITSRKQQSIPLPGFPLCITVVDNSTVAVTLPNTNKVVMVDIRQGHIIKHIDVKDICIGIMYSNNQLFVGCFNNTIKVLSLSGEITNTIQLGFIPYYMCGSDDGSIYCTDHDKLYCIDTKGKILFTFTHPDMDYPSGITTDDTGHVLVVCYRSDNILSISSDGKQCQIIVEHIIPYIYEVGPYICYNQQSKSFAVGRSKTIDVYKLC